MSNAIDVHHLSKTYRLPSLLPFHTKRQTKALQDISFSCPKGKISCILGPNGAGKTTTIKILARLIEPDKGEVTLSGIPLNKAPLHINAQIGILTPNERSFYWRLTGRQNLEFFASLYNLEGKIKQERIREVLREADLLEDADKPFRLYSAGMRQKLLLARALINRPSFLLLDEPTTHLDPIMRSSVHQLILNYLGQENNPTILLCTHDLTEAQELSDHLIFLHQGSVKAEGTLSSLRKNLQPHLSLHLQFKTMPHPSWADGLHLTVSKEQNNYLAIEIYDREAIPHIINSAVSGGGELYSCEHSEESLTTLFSRIYDGEAH